MSGRCSCKDKTARYLSLKSNPYILHKASGGYQFSIFVLFDLINVPFTILLVSLSHSHKRPVMTLVNVFKQILDCLDAPTCLNIDVAVEQTEKIRVVRHDPSVVKFVSIDFFFLAIFTPSVNWI
jgi:hypothetical protein